MQTGNFGWTCPFCGRDTTITEADRSDGRVDFYAESAEGSHSLNYQRIVCPNEECRKYSLSVWLHSTGFNMLGNRATSELIKSWRLIPQSHAKVFPDYIPQPLRDDYTEACVIRDLSPKASATLSRRCLQGMIRDFWAVSKPRLKDEIDAIKDLVDLQTWQAIDGVRSVGNIGAHMEKEISLIIDVEPEEAGLLIWLIESLMKEWYIQRHEREQRLSEIAELAEAKERAKRRESASEDVH